MDENNNNDILNSENDNPAVSDTPEEETTVQPQNDSVVGDDSSSTADTDSTSQNYYTNNNYSSPYNNQYTQPVNNYNYTPYYTGTPDNNNNNNYDNNNKNGKKKGIKVVFIIIAVILVIALVFGAVIFFFGKNPPNGPESLTGDGTVITTSITPDYATPTGEVLDSVKVAEIGRASCVGILVYSSNGFSQTEAGEGTGVVATRSKDGKSTYIITCAHVISDNGVSVKILLEDGTTYDAAIVGYDLQTDVGVLKVNSTELTCAQFGDFSKLKIGSPVYAVGNPGGSEFFGSVTNGIVSAISRSINNEIGYTMDCIQHNAAINPGNSGGALLNEYGQVIGINSSKIASTEYEGMSFAVPISTALEVANQLIESGYVPNRPKLGITYSLATSHDTYAMIVQIKGLPAGSLIIRSISDDSDLNNSNIQKGDMITAVNGKDLDTPDILLDIIDNSKVGETLKLRICRINTDYSVEEFDVKVALVEDKGSTAPQEEETTYINPFDYFEQYGGGYGN